MYKQKYIKYKNSYDTESQKLEVISKKFNEKLQDLKNVTEQRDRMELTVLEM